MKKYISDDELQNILIQYMLRNNLESHIEYIMEMFHTLEVKTRYDTIQEIKNMVELDQSIMILTSASKFIH